MTLRDLKSIPAHDIDTQGPQFRVLVVDDDAANRDALVRRLQRRGYRVDSAPGGREALETIEHATFDLVLLDVMMPGLSGLEVLQRLRERYQRAELPVIMATAQGASDDVAEALRLGANDHVTKPIDFTVALARVQIQLELRQSFQAITALKQRLSERNAELENLNCELRLAQERTQRDMEVAAKVQGAFLPPTSPKILNVGAAWRYQPCEQLAGDALNINALDDHHLGFYLLDVSGHGVAAALTAVAVARLLGPAHDPNSILVQHGAAGPVPVSPSEVAHRLGERFAFNSTSLQFITCFYGVLDTRSGELKYVSAGHPSPLLIGRGSRIRLVEATGLPLGLGDSYSDSTIQLHPGDRLFLYSDGVLEAVDPTGRQFGLEGLQSSITEMLRSTLDESIAEVIKRLNAWCHASNFRDDVSLLALEYAPQQ